jgi:hypothetical protein
MKTTRLALAAILLAGSSLLATVPTVASPPPGHWGGPHGGPGGHPSFHFSHHDFGHFTPFEHQAWVGGSWNHAWHNGRFGWWWFAGGAWYFYDAPIYPYPSYVSDYYVDEGENGPGQNWYYCNNPPGYYPYVRSCAMPWQAVPATPPPPAPGPGYGPPPGAMGGPPPGYGPPPSAPGGPPPGYQGPDNVPGPNDQPPPGYNGPGNLPPPPQNGAPPQNGYNGPDGNGQN